MSITRHRGYTLIELTVSVGLFAIIMMLASGAYIMMLGLNRQAQGIASGIDNISYALENMTRTIRTGSVYNCAGSGDCPNGGTSFSLLDTNHVPVSYNLDPASSAIQQTVGGVTSTLTDPSVTITALTFYASGTTVRDPFQPHVTIVVSGSVSGGAGKAPQNFTIETGATMRGSDI